ncbi:MAG: 30S ribosomal protein S4 [Candidatus Curtissbacteria bacterium GW2011_GWA1_40_9]|uniref:Small ribosomal subunit protein uS4 n=1 Tax=Candidatus Curtissbacteria bacterium GW2011_GWA1_40_9 TaxID=1618408 RepID=A0A0G0W106_9BACT|nr:MAG: 30S ribosomal protein S4 [Candidatus Curtissbacteria bacterium GW2011_GWA1_40_9]
MARYTGPKHKLCRAEGTALCGLSTCPVIRKNAGPPGQHGQKGRRKLSEYGIQLREKQKVKRIYGVLERQFEKYFNLASRQKATTGDALLNILETRLDNVVYRLNLAKTRFQARQLVSHGHIRVNGKKVTIPSYNVKIGDIITLSEKTSNLDFIKKLQEETKGANLPLWLEKKATVGKIKSMPKREDIDSEINERLIVEFYSR